MSDDTALGPLDFILIEFPEDASTAPVAAALGDVLDRGIVRLFDVAAVHKAADGSPVRIALADGAPGLAPFAGFAGAESGLFGPDDIEQVAEALEPRTSGLMLAFENSWAGAFVTAAHTAGGRVVASERIPAQALLDVLDLVEAADA